ncbi:MAG: shikimate kinase, partial [Myxococcota bacterium]|nr:shikimate kinase [Myxococcota bacterium]
PWSEIELRLGSGAGRPLSARARELFERRASGYDRAGVGVEVAGCTTAEAVERILEALRC